MKVNFCAYTIKKVKRQPTEWKTAFAIIYLIRDLYLGYIKNSIIKRQLNFKMGKGSEYTFFQRRYTHSQSTRDAQHH